MVDAANSYSHATGWFDIEVEPQAIQNVVTADLLLLEFNAAREDLAVPVHDDQANLVRTIGCRGYHVVERNQQDCTYYGRQNTSQGYLEGWIQIE
jgi:hypothetical protein